MLTQCAVDCVVWFWENWILIAFNFELFLLRLLYHFCACGIWETLNLCFLLSFEKIKFGIVNPGSQGSQELAVCSNSAIIWYCHRLFKFLETLFIYCLSVTNFKHMRYPVLNALKDGSEYCYSRYLSTLV